MPLKLPRVRGSVPHRDAQNELTRIDAVADPELRPITVA
jgi:hypothetical protein